MTEPKISLEGLVPVVVQDADTGALLTLAYADQQALDRTLATGQSHFYSRSRRKLWHKGETSGHVQEVVSIARDCDGDALLYQVRPRGPACHTGAATCFHDPVTPPASPRLGEMIGRVAAVVAQRNQERPEGAYTTYLFEQGLDKIGKKIGEEATETVIALKNADPDAIASEAADLLYHLLVALEASGVSTAQVAAVLDSRFGQASKLPRDQRPEA